MGFLSFKSETFHCGIKCLRACGDANFCAQQREGEACEAREARVLEAKGMVVAQCSCATLLG